VALWSELVQSTFELQLFSYGVPDAKLYQSSKAEAEPLDISDNLLRELLLLVGDRDLFVPLAGREAIEAVEDLIREDEGCFGEVVHVGNILKVLTDLLDHVQGDLLSTQEITNLNRVVLSLAVRRHNLPMQVLDSLLARQDEVADQAGVQAQQAELGLEVSHDFKVYEHCLLLLEGNLRHLDNEGLKFICIYLILPVLSRLVWAIIRVIIFT